MTNANPQTTADFVGCLHRRGRGRLVSSGRSAPREPRRMALSLPKEDRRAKDTDSQTGDRDGTPLVQTGDCECQDRGYQPAHGDHDDDRRRFEQGRGQGRRFRLTGLGRFGAH